jgi:hypothetical protein
MARISSLSTRSVDKAVEKREINKAKQGNYEAFATLLKN